jgi:hypothetical protein
VGEGERDGEEEAEKYVDDAELGVLFIVILKILEVNTVLVNGKE